MNQCILQEGLIEKICIFETKVFKFSGELGVSKTFQPIIF